MECDRLQLGSWCQRGRKAASSYTASPMGQEGPARDKGSVSGGWCGGGTMGPFEGLLPTPEVPDYAYWTETLRNYLTLGALFLLLGCKAVVQGSCWRKWT